eukprot:Em0018g804a
MNVCYESVSPTVDLQEHISEPWVCYRATCCCGCGQKGKVQRCVASAQSSQVFKGKGKGGNGPGGVSGAAMRTEVIGGSQRLVLSLFTVNSAIGVISPGQSVVISVECGPTKQANMRRCLWRGDETFLYKSVIVGQSAKARFKISNPNKIPCDVNILVKSSSVQKVKGAADIFEVEPSKVNIPSHSHVYAVVTFRPTAMQLYSATFEAVAEGSQTLKAKGLTFELQGEGNLPQVSIEKPVLRNAQGHPLLLFKRLMVGNAQGLPLVVRNVGTIPATLVMTLGSGHESFSIARPKLGVDEVKELKVLFQPAQPNKCSGELQLKIQDNQFENLRIVLVGEGYKDDVAIDNIQSIMEEVGESATSMQVHINHLQFGGCPVGESKQLSFVLSNHSTSQAIRFQFPSLPGLSFSPCVGHLHPNSSKDIVVTFRPAKPQTMTAQRLCAKITKIKFSHEISQVPDWDDRMKSVRWVTAPLQGHQGVHDASPTSPGRPPPTPAKQKVIETEPETPHAVVDGSHRDLELTASGVAGYTNFPLKNVGPIPLAYKWTALDQNENGTRDAMEPKSDAGSSCSVGKEVSPFSVTPASGVILVGQETNFTVRFSPLDLVDMQCMFRCNVPHLDQSCRPLDLKVQGLSLMPYCHFELEENNYLTMRQAETRGGLETRTGPAIDSATRVIEFHSRGIGVKNHKEFSIINPTASGYEFNWTPENSSIALFKCLTPRGYIAGGKKHDVAFDFTPTTLDLVESDPRHLSCIPTCQTEPFHHQVDHMRQSNIAFTERPYAMVHIASKIHVSVEA